MPIMKLEEGAPVTITIASTEPSLGKFGPQWLFIGVDDSRLYVSEQSTLRGLERLGLDTESCVGETIRFSRVIKNGTKFTNLDRATAGEAAAPVAARPAPAARVQRSVAELGVLYAECVDAAMMSLGVKLEAAEIPFDAIAIQAAAATIFIQANK
jgi:hypothetical protein